jgi:hypothetical protein
MNAADLNAGDLKAALEVIEDVGMYAVVMFTPEGGFSSMTIPTLIPIVPTAEITNAGLRRLPPEPAK